MSEIMTPVKEKYLENQKLMCNYVSSHPEIKPLINSFVEVQKANKESRHVRLHISVGEATNEGFLVYLKNRINNPKIIFSSFNEKDENKIPQVEIFDGNNTVVTFSVDCIKIISSEIKKDNECNFNRYDFKVRFNDKFDYSIRITVDKYKCDI